MADYVARIIDKVHYQPGAWNGSRVGVYRIDGDNEELVGEYPRSYPSLGRTFYPFQQNGIDLALYSPSYTGTRILRLPDCIDLGGEEPDAMGFCPAEYFVPSYGEMEYISDGASPRRYRKNNPKPGDLAARHIRTPYQEIDGTPQVSELYSCVVTPVTYYPFGFVAGCVWGDDSSWKLQYLDLGDAGEGIVRRDDRFGYLVLPSGLTLQQAIDMEDYLYDEGEDDANMIRVAVRQDVDLRTGKAYEHRD